MQAEASYQAPLAASLFAFSTPSTLTSIRPMKAIITTLLILPIFSGSLYSLNDGAESGSGKTDIACNTALFYDDDIYLIGFQFCSKTLSDATEQMASTLELLNEPFPASSEVYSFYQCETEDCLLPSTCHLYEFVVFPAKEIDSITVHYWESTEEWCVSADLFTRRGVGCLPCGESFSEYILLEFMDSPMTFPSDYLSPY